MTNRKQKKYRQARGNQRDDNHHYITRQGVATHVYTPRKKPEADNALLAEELFDLAKRVSLTRKSG